MLKLCQKDSFTQTLVWEIIVKKKPVLTWSFSLDFDVVHCLNFFLLPQKRKKYRL